MLVVYYTVDQVVAVRRLGLREYAADPYNYVIWANLGLFYALIAFRVQSIVALNGLKLSAATLANYVDIAPISYYALQENIISAVNFTLVFLKFFKVRVLTLCHPRVRR